jgi:phthiocerol/phenolphthiocerol synthesis type-I polyketide synthase E
MSRDSAHSHKIAIIGIACRVPGAVNAEQFWQAIASGRDTWKPITDEELRERGVPQQDLDSPFYVRATRTLEGIDQFDAGFFGVTPREARYMDPQQRVFLECCYEALESAGYPSGEAPLSVGVFAGAATSTYMVNHILPNSRAPHPNEVLVEHAHGNDKDYLTTVASYRLNLCGPSMSINTACSTSMLCVVQACKALLNQDCDMALAGGVRIELPAGVGYKFRKGGILSPDGRCAPFDASAQGTAFADGAGIVLLKRFEEAVRDNDHIYAVINGFATNNDGGAKVGYASPSPKGQESVLREALAFAAIPPRWVGYLEAHGTATVVGDPIEFSALSQVYPPADDEKPYCVLGSVKANFGHLNTAAGIAGLIKAAHVLRHRMLPPQINFRQINSAIPLAKSAFRICTELEPFPARMGPRHAAVSSYGIGGSNAHVILEEAPQREHVIDHEGPHLLVLSARSAPALQEQVNQLQRHLVAHPEQSLADVAFTLQQGRRHFPYRASFLCRDRSGAINVLQTGVGANLMPSRASLSVVFMLPGQGGQYRGMGRALYEGEPNYRATVDRCLAVVADDPGYAELYEAFFADTLDGQGVDPVFKTHIAQPLLFITEYALSQLWMSRGVRPDALIGHSLGEYVAACLSGALTLEDALRLVMLRGRLMGTLAIGAMMSVALGAPELRALCPIECEVAASNSPGNSVASGSPAAVSELESILHARGISTQRLATAHAFHSAMVEPIVPDFLAALNRVRFSAPVLPFVSNVTGTWITAAQASSPEYWIRHLRSPVLFSEGLREILSRHEASVLIEVGPGSGLSQLARKQRFEQLHVVTSLRERERDERGYMLHALGKCWESGAEVDWRSLSKAETVGRVPLPTYPFQRSRYWIDVNEPAARVPASDRIGRHSDLSRWFYVPTWKSLPSWAPTRSPKPQRCLLLQDEDSPELAELLRQQGHDVRCVKRGERFMQTHDGFCIESLSAADYGRINEFLNREGWQPERIVCAWDVSVASQPTSSSAQRALLELLYLAKALAGMPGRQIDLRLVTANVFDVCGDEQIQPDWAVRVGACRALADEIHSLTCQCIDIDATSRHCWVALAHELDRPVTERVIALRGNKRWAEHFTPLPLGTAETTPLRSGGTYLLTGGWGGTGRAVANWLARSVSQPTLVMLSRREVPTRDRWTEILDAQHDSHLVEDIRLIKELESQGAHVLPVCADVSDVGQVRKALNEVTASTRRIDGVFHMAGLASNATLEHKSAEAVLRILAPKIDGVKNIYEVLGSYQPDFVILFSSIAAIRGGIRQFEYSAANAYLDAYAARVSKESGCRWVSINWDAWQTGMATATVVPEHLERLKAAVLQEAISVVEGTEALERIIASGISPQIVVFTRELYPRPVAASRVSEPPRMGESPHAPEDTRLQSTHSAHGNPTEKRLAEIWIAHMGHERIGRHDNFFDLGGDSLLATKVVGAINSELNIDIGVRDFLESRHIEDLARLVDTLTAQAHSGESPSVLQEQVW